MKNKTILLAFVIGIFMFSFASVSATILEYDTNTRTATFNNNFLFIKTGEIATAQLITPLNYKVGLGEQYVWEQKITGFDSYQDFISSMDFYDKKNGMAKINRDYDLRKRVVTPTLVDDYTCTDTIVQNGTIENECVVSGNHLEDRITYTPLKQVDFKKNDVLFIRMYTFVEEGDVVEWIPTMAGKRIPEWATWTADLNTDIVSYYKLDESSGTVIDSLGTYNGTNSGATASSTGLINTAYDFDGSNDYINLGIIDFADYGETYSVSVWFYQTTFAVFGDIVGHWEGSKQFMIRSGADNYLYAYTGGDGAGYLKSSNTKNLNEWNHAVLTKDGTTVKLYLNNVSVTDTSGGITTTDNLNLYLGANNRYLGGVSIFFDGKTDEFGIWNRALTSTEITQLYNSGTGITYDANPITVTAISPANDTTFTTTGNKDFTCYGSDGENFTDMEFYLNGALEQTNSSGLNNTNYVFTESLTDGVYNWTCIGYDDEANTGTFTARTFTVDTTSPTIDLVSPNETFDYMYENFTLQLNFTATDTNLDTCWYDYNDTNNTMECSTGVLNSSNFNYTKDVNNLTVYANDSVGNTGSQLISWGYKVFENNRTINSTSYQTQSETFKIDLTANSSLTAVTLNYNGTNYATTKSGTSYSKTFDIPTANLGNNSVRWKFTYGAENFYSSYSYQNISETVFTICNASYTNDFLNITFKDEALLTYINASIPTSTFEYYLGSGTVTKSYTYVNTTNNYFYNFCATPDLTFNIDTYVQYKQGTSYPQRIYDPDALTINSTVTNKVLYLLSSIDGIYVTFQVINTANQVISGVEVTGTREISGEDVIVANGLTGAGGTVTFWLNPDFVHDFTFTKSGLTTYETSFAPTQTSYSVTLAGGTTTVNDYTKGMAYTILPSNTSLTNDTTYDFGFLLASSFWDVDSYGFNLKLNNGTIITGDSTSTAGTQLTKTYDVNNQTRIYLEYYWLVNETYNNGTREWMIYNTEYTQWSIKTFFTDLNMYLDSGLFGIDDFGRYLLIFLLLFMTVGILGYKYGFNNPMFVTGLIFFVVFFFDVAIGIIPTIKVLNGNEVPYILTFISGLLFAINVIREVSR